MAALSHLDSREMREMLERREIFLHFCMLEELFEPEDTTVARGSMKRDLWKHIPEEVLERVLLFLPAASQARLCAVCNRWKKLMCSSPFRKLSAAIAFHSGDTLCICNIEDPFYSVKPCYVPLEGQVKMGFKVHKLVIPAELRGFDPVYHWSSHGSLTAIGLEKDADDCTELRICIFSVVDKTWRELPRHSLARLGKLTFVNWKLRVVENRDQECSFQVFVACAADDEDEVSRISLDVYSSSTDTWSASPLHLRLKDDVDDVPLWHFVVGKGESVYGCLLPRDTRDKVVRMRTDGKYANRLPSLPRAAAQGKWAFDASYDRETLFLVTSSSHMFKCGHSSKKWELVSEMPGDVRAKIECPTISDCELLHAEIVDDVILMVVEVEERSKYILAYHIARGSWKWVAQPTSFYDHYRFRAAHYYDHLRLRATSFYVHLGSHAPDHLRPRAPRPNLGSM